MGSFLLFVLRVRSVSAGSPAMPDGMQAMGGLRIRLSDHGLRLICRYGKVTLSIHPQTHTEDMHSWFPIFFPLKEPIHCPAGAAIQAHMWRCSANHKVGRPASLAACSPLWSCTCMCS